MALAVAGVALLLGSASLARAAEGYADPAFGTNGIVTFSASTFGVPNSGALGSPVAAALANGEIIAVAKIYSPLTAVLFKVNAAGAIDSTFGTNGFVTIPAALIGTGFALENLAIQSDGKILLAGWNDSAESFLIRFLPNGAIDTSFGNGGAAPIYLPQGTIAVWTDAEVGLLVQPDGKILLGQPNWLSRYLSSGALDTSFGSGGHVSLPSTMIPSTLALQPDGRIVIGSAAGRDGAPGSSTQFELARINADGSMDTTFGSGGFVTTNPAPSASANWVVELAVQSDGKILALGTSETTLSVGPPPTVQTVTVLARYLPSGVLDSSYGTAGIVTSATGEAFDFELQPDGKALVSSVFAKLGEIARFDVNGAPDTTFGTNGSNAVQLATDNGNVTSQGDNDPILLLPSGRAIVTTTYYDSSTANSVAFVGYVIHDPSASGTAEAWSLTPASISFLSASNVPIGSAQDSALATVSGLDPDVTVPAFVTNGTSAIDGSLTYDSNAKWAVNGTQIGLQVISSTAPGTTTSATVVIGGLASKRSPTYSLAPTATATYSVTTVPPVAVPNVVGLTQAAASMAITGAGLVVGTITAQASSAVAAGSVISESPAAGTGVAPGSSIDLVLSSGPPPVMVPNVVGMTQAAASTAITGAGLLVGTVTNQSSSTIAAGSVISESPAAGTSVASGSSVDLIVSSGPPSVAVPNVVGMTQSNASTAITGAGLVVGTITNQSSSTVAAGSVISETPAAGTSVASGSSVALEVSSGPPASSSSGGGGGAVDTFSLILLALLMAARTVRAGRSPELGPPTARRQVKLG